MNKDDPDDDVGLDAVRGRIVELARPDPPKLFGSAIRQSIDEVLDGPRTGRWDFAQLEKTEKTYVGTKIEIVVRTALGLERGPKLDLEIDGHDLDIKWSMSSAWQIPQEAVGELCLCIGGLKGLSQFQVGIVRCSREHLNKGKNRDLKGTLSSAGREAMVFLVEPTRLPTNFVAEMDSDIRNEVMSQKSIQERVATLFLRLPYTPIPRSAVATAARTTGDPMRRVRADSHAVDPLQGMSIVSAKYGKKTLEALGQPPMDPDHFMSVPKHDLARLPAAIRNELGLD